VIEPIGDVGGDGGHLLHPGPVEQQIVIVEHALPLLGLAGTPPALM
jgi:hypothetical protein